jgi:hypothetical protein
MAVGAAVPQTCARLDWALRKQKFPTDNHPRTYPTDTNDMVEGTALKDTLPRYRAFAFSEVF